MSRIHQTIARAMDERVFPGCVVGWTGGEGCDGVRPFGKLTYDPDSRDVTADTVYDVASVTKSIPVACLAWYLIERGCLTLDTSVRAFVPEFQGPFSDRVRIGHLLTQTLDFGYSLSSHKDRSSNELLDIVLRRGLRAPPGPTVYQSHTA